MRKIARSAGVISLSTGLSRILGLIRDLLLAHLFGTTIQAQAFVVAFRLPNLFRELVAEGAVTSAFVPVLSGLKARNQETEFWSAARVLFWRLSFVLLLIGGLGAWGAPWIVQVAAPGFLENPEKFELTVLLTRWLFPFIILAGWWAYCMGVLNSRQRFALPALGPAILNVAVIIACVHYVSKVQPGILAVVWGVLVGGVVQILIQLPVMRREGFRFGFQWNHPATGEMLRLFLPRVLGAAVYQANVLIHTLLASLAFVVGEGAVAALYFANRLVHLPMALFGTALAQASLPSLTEQATHKQWDAFGETLRDMLRIVACVLFPSAVGLAVLSEPIVRLLFQRGAFDAYSTYVTTQALIFYAIGLWAPALGKVLTGAFYAMKDTRTPVRLAAEAVAVNVVLSVILMWPMQVGGLALASSIAGLVNVIRLILCMQKRLQFPLLRGLMIGYVRVLIASLLMGALTYSAWYLAGLSRLGLTGLGLTIVASTLSYLGICWIMKINEMQRLVRSFRKR